MPTIRVPDLARPPMADDGSDGPPADFDYQELEVTQKQADRWKSLNEKEQLTLVLKADREHRDLRDYL